MGTLTDEIDRAQNKYRDENEQVEVPNGWRAPPLYFRAAMWWLFWGGIVLGIGAGFLGGYGPPVELVASCLTSIGWMLVLGWVLAVAIDWLVIAAVGW